VSGVRVGVSAALLAACLSSACALAPATSLGATKRKLPVLRVRPKLAPGRKASATLGPQGGRLHVKTPGGMVVTLVLPAGSLGQPTKVTLTPLSALKRVPFKRGVAGAVQLGPEGLVLHKRGKLLLRPRKPVPKQLQTPFSATGNGSSFHVYPGKAGRVMTVPLMHFSIYGEGEASKQERRVEAGRQQSSPQATVERDLATNQSDQHLADAFEPYAARVASEVAAALTDDAKVSVALDDALTLAEELELAGWSSDELKGMGDRLPAAASSKLRQLIGEIRASFPDQILANALARALDRCEADHSQASRDDVLSIMETQRLFGAIDEIDLSLLDRCYGLQVEITSTRSGSSDTTGPAPLNEHATSSYQHTLHAVVPLDAADTGSGSLTWTAFSDHFQSYFPNGSGQCYGTGPATDSSDGQAPQPGSVGVQLTQDPAISMTLSITPAPYTIHSVGTGCGAYTSDDVASDDGGFQGLFSSGVSPAGTGAYKVTGWEVGAAGSDVLATKTIALGDGTITLRITRAG
jgi:hypothetical protein